MQYSTGTIHAMTASAMTNNRNCSCNGSCPAFLQYLQIDGRRLRMDAPESPQALQAGILSHRPGPRLSNVSLGRYLVMH